LQWQGTHHLECQDDDAGNQQHQPCLERETTSYLKEGVLKEDMKESHKQLVSTHKKTTLSLSVVGIKYILSHTIVRTSKDIHFLQWEYSVFYRIQFN